MTAIPAHLMTIMQLHRREFRAIGGTDPTLTTTANGIDVISGYVHSSTQIMCSIEKAFG